METAALLALGERCCDIAYLDEEAARRGVAAVLADMHAARPVVKARGGTALLERFTDVLTVVEAEARALAGWAPMSGGISDAARGLGARYPKSTTAPNSARGAFLQQIRNRAFELRLREIQTAAERRLDELGVPHLRERIKTGRASTSLKRTLIEGVYEANAVLLGADGKQAISGTRRGIHPSPGGVTVWSLETGQLVRSFIAHPEHAVTCLARTRDDRLLLTGSSDNTARVWDRTTDRRIYELSCHRGPVWSIAASPNGSVAVTASLDATMGVWDLETGKLLRTITGLAEPPMEVVFHPDGRKIVVASTDGAVTVWDAVTGARLALFQKAESGARSIALSQDGRRAITGHLDGSLRVWDVDAVRGGLLSILKGHSADVVGVRFTGFERAISGSRDGTVRLWDLARGVEIGTLWSHTGPLTGIDVDAEGQELVSSAKDGSVRVWDLPIAFRELQTRADAPSSPDVPSAGVRRVAVSLDGKWAAAAHDDCSFTVWSLVTGQITRTIQGYKGDDRVERIDQIRISADGRALVTAAILPMGQCAVTLWDVASGQMYRELDEIGAQVGISGDARWAVGVRTKGSAGIYAWSMETGQIAYSLFPRGERNEVWSVVVSSSGDRAAYWWWRGRVHAWDVLAEREIHELDGSVARVLSGDGTRLVVDTGGWDANDLVRIYDLDWEGEVAACRKVLEIPGKEEMGISFTGRHLAWQDGGLILLDLENGAEEILRLRTDARLTCSAFTPDGRTIIAGDAAGMIHILDLEGIETG
ncbi:MAG: WD40 repeat domain-containing protein [Polyangiaceae bacterium]